MPEYRNQLALARVPLIGERRVGTRYRGWTMARIEMRLGESVVDVHDLSETGACFTLRNGLVPEIGSIVRLNPIGMTGAAGTIVWAHRDRFGIALNQPIADPELWLDPAAHGHDFLAALIRFQRDSGS